MYLLLSRQCSENHIPNEITKKAIESVKANRGLKKAVTVEELFKKLS